MIVLQFFCRLRRELAEIFTKFEKNSANAEGKVETFRISSFGNLYLSSVWYAQIKLFVYYEVGKLTIFSE